MKTEFELEHFQGPQLVSSEFKLSIIGNEPKEKPYVTLVSSHGKKPLFMKDRDLERFAVNILKSLKSKRLDIYCDQGQKVRI